MSFSFQVRPPEREWEEGQIKTRGDRQNRGEGNSRTGCGLISNGKDRIPGWKRKNTRKALPSGKSASDGKT